MKCWGAGGSGNLGYGDTSDRGDEASEMGTNLPVIELGTGKTAKQISLGNFFTCAILNDDTLKCWGRGSLGRLGYGDTNNRGDGANGMGDNLETVDLGTNTTVKQVGVGFQHTCAVLNDDTVKCWGRGSDGQLGYGDMNNRGDQANEMGNNLLTVDLGTGKTAKQLFTGFYHNCAILNDYTVKCWGDNSRGQLGYGDTTKRGDGPNQMGNHLPVVDLGTNKRAKQIVLGSAHTCAILNDDTVKCWGNGGNGILGSGDTSHRGNTGAGANTCNDGKEMGDCLPIVNLGTNKKAKQLAAGGYHTCALLNDDTVKCWGQGNSGQLGYGDTSKRGDGPNEMGNNLPTVDLGTGKSAKQIFASKGDQTCAILNDDTVKCWGDGGSGRLGYGDTQNRGDGANEMGDKLPVVDIGGMRPQTLTYGCLLYTSPSPRD